MRDAKREAHTPLHAWCVSLRGHFLFPLAEIYKERFLERYQIRAEAKSILKSDSKFETFLEMGFIVGLIVNRL